MMRGLLLLVRPPKRLPFSSVTGRCFPLTILVTNSDIKHVSSVTILFYSQSLYCAFRFSNAVLTFRDHREPGRTTTNFSIAVPSLYNPLKCTPRSALTTKFVFFETRGVWHDRKQSRRKRNKSFVSLQYYYCSTNSQSKHSLCILKALV